MNEKFPIVSTPSGIISVFNFLQSLNAHLPIFLAFGNLTGRVLLVLYKMQMKSHLSLQEKVAKEFLLVAFHQNHFLHHFQNSSEEFDAVLYILIGLFFYRNTTTKDCAPNSSMESGNTISSNDVH